MIPNRRSFVVFGVLITVCLVIAGWQTGEHLRVREASRTLVVNRARDITTTLGLVLRSQRRFGVISKERLESALNELIRTGEVESIALLSTGGEVIAFSGKELELPNDGVQAGVHWGENAVTVVNLVDLGTNVTQEAEAPPMLIIPREQFPPPPTNFPPPGAFTNQLAQSNSTNGTNPAARPPGWRWPRGGSGGTNRTGFSRPFWMSESDYKTAIKKQGVHRCAIVMSFGTMRAITREDLLLRTLVVLLSAAAAGISGLAWRNLIKTADLQIRLVKASEMNAHLKGLNLAAAGLAHETRNPLNIIRGLAQMISKENDASAETRRRAREITDETDRVTAQLNEFINYSRPREVRRGNVALGNVSNEVVRALNYDLEEKSIKLQVTDEGLTIEADEQLLRQTLFNLLINAIQATDANGEIQIVAYRTSPEEAALEIRDNGHGVPPEQRQEIFKPYFTTHQKGTGLGLAVVQQIVSAHGWEIVCLGNEPKGAIFRISRLRISRAA